MFGTMRMMAGIFSFFYRALDGMGVVVLGIIVGLIILIYLLQAYLIYLMVLLGILAAIRIFLWFRMRYW